MTEDFKLVPLQQWICDTCGEVIESPDECYVIWREKGEGSEFRVIHRGVCDNRDFHSSAPVEDFLGVAGINKLLSLLSAGPLMIKANQNNKGLTRIEDLDEYVDFFKRVQVPYYEEARQRFNDQDLIEDFSDCNEVYPYQERVLKRIITGEWED